MTAPGYLRPAATAEATRLLSAAGARALGGGTDLLPRLDRGLEEATTLVDLRDLGLDAIEVTDAGGLRIGATASLAAVARHAHVRERFGALAEACAATGSPQLREMGTIAGSLCQHVRCWYYRHPDLTCWLGGGDTCYAQIGDHRKHGLEPGDCISVAPSDAAAALLALAARFDTDRRSGVPLAELFRRPTGDNRSTLTLSEGELVTAVAVPAAPDASCYRRAGERAAWSFALVGVAAARFGAAPPRVAAIGVSNLPRLLDPADPLAELPGLPMTGWKRRLLATLVDDALEVLRA